MRHILVRDPYADPVFPEVDLLCALAAKSEGASFKQIEQMFGGGGPFMKALGQFLSKWLPDWSPSFNPNDPVAQRAAIHNYVRSNDPSYMAAEWAVE